VPELPGILPGRETWPGIAMVVLGAAGLGAALWLGRTQRLRARALARLGRHAGAAEASGPAGAAGAAGTEDATAAEAAAGRRRVPVVRSRTWIGWCAGAAVALGLLFLVRPAFAFAAGIAVGAVAAVVESYQRSRHALRLEQQLADTIDLLIGALRAGAGMVDALERAGRTARAPLGPILSEASARLRLGERPQEVLGDVAARVPLESFRLLAFALTVNWEAGGSLAPTLATVGRSVRDRVELSRRIQSQSAPTVASIVSLMGASYGIAWLTWLNNPDNVERFIATPTGGLMVAGTVVLQGLGLLWMWKWSQVRL